ncbi:MAG: ribonuclease HI [Chloroflexota bacterium]|nr:ribonuclease HI [Chloroflexota bacterium]
MDDAIIVYSDGGCKPNPGRGGWAALLIWGDMEKELSGGDLDTTNNRMELTAAVRALEALKRPCKVDFYTDSEYLKNGISSWIKGWKRNGWKTAKGDPVLNRDLWTQLDDLTQKHTIAWKWTRGHAGDAHNERVDQLATQARNRLGRG